MKWIVRWLLLLGIVAGPLGAGGCSDPEVGSMPPIKGSPKKDAIQVPHAVKNARSPRGR